MKLQDIGVVVIGRNEGERLARCLDALTSRTEKIVYVDSASTDNSLQIAVQRNVHVLQLDMTVGFTAARARNAGVAKLLALYPQLELIQFVDGDCELNPDWFSKAIDFLEGNEDVAVVCGRRRERFADATIYNMLCDFEWDTPTGEAKACGGDALIRVNAFKEVRGFTESLIAGEEPELCLRLRKNGWKIWRLGEEMTLHDAAMTKFSQWWRRMIRGGYAFAEGAYLHGDGPEFHWVKESRSAWFWGGIFPVIVLVSWLFAWQLGALLLFVYPLQIARIAKRMGEQANKWLIATFMVIGKVPEALGQIKFSWHVLTGKEGRLIEYK